MWSALAQQMVSQNTWKDTWVLGVSLYTAHNLVLAAQNVSANKVGGSPGQQGGVATDKTVGAVSVSYDAQSMSEKDAGWWNLTTYGKQFYRLSRLFGAGPVQL